MDRKNDPRRKREMYAQLKNLQIERIDIDEAIALVALGKQMSDGYAAFSLPVPEWLDENLKTLQKEIRERRRDYLESSLKEAKARRAALRTAEEKRSEAEAEIQRLEKALAGGQ